MSVLIGSIAWSRVLIIAVVVFFLFSCFRRKRPGRALFHIGLGLVCAAFFFSAIFFVGTRITSSVHDRHQRGAEVSVSESRIGRRAERIRRRVTDHFGNTVYYEANEENNSSRADSLVPATIQIKLQPVWIETTGITRDQLANGLVGAIEFIREIAVDPSGEAKVNIVELSELAMTGADSASPLRLGDVARPIREQSPAGRDSRDVKVEIKVERGTGRTDGFTAGELAETLKLVSERSAGQANLKVTLHADRLVVHFTQDAGEEENLSDEEVADATTVNEDSGDDKAAAVADSEDAASSKEASTTEAATADVSAAIADSSTRPDWMDTKLGFSTKDNVFRMIGSSRVFESVEDAASQQAQANALHDQAIKYMAECLNIDAREARRVPVRQLFVLPEQKNRVVKASWIGPAHIESTTVTEVLADNDTQYYQLYTLYEFDERTRHDLTKLWQKTKIEKQLWYTGTGAGLVFALLATLLGYLRVDTNTRGYYSGRLKLAAGAVGTAIVATAVMLLDSI